jgi:tetratricopeptide (TPR) repeat protein
MRIAVLGLLLLALSETAAADKRPPALDILERAITGEKDAKVLTQALADLDALIKKSPKDADAHYARGWVLSRVGKRDDEAVAAYDRAFDLDPRLADAAYNAGVVLGRLGNPKDAALRFDRALRVNPKHADAAYNAGQSYYDVGDFEAAAARWETASKLQPDDFQIAKKLVQAYVGVGKPGPIARARQRVFAMWKAHKDPDLAKLKSYVYDQLAVGKYHVYVYEAFEPSEAVPMFQAKIALKDKVIGSVTLESKSGRYVVGVDKAGEHTVLTEHDWKKPPDYRTWKDIVTKTIDKQF